MTEHAALTQPWTGRNGVWRLREALGNPLSVLDIPLQKVKGRQGWHPFGAVRDHLQPIASPDGAPAPATVASHSGKLAWRRGKQSGRSARREL